ncbi:MAG: peptidase U32 family protein [Candidatus Altiarchaeota archaeon]
MTSIELLSPAGGWDCLKAAAAEGADAVYFGVGSFNARVRAGNFDLGELSDAVKFCHDRGVKAYLAVNTLVKNAEVGEWFGLVGGAYSAGVDAVIIQELSFAKILTEKFGDLEVHASTQSGIFNSFHSRLLPGVDRVILPRELTLNQVKDFSSKTGLPVEVFAQGALCFSVGGQCLMSSFLGGRSGNRGLCAQPCRKKYAGDYLLSARDLCVAEKVGELAESGVRALKIEGRLRSPEYVGAATAVYRRLLDEGRLDYDAYLDMELAFSREYTLGALFRDFDVVASGVAGKRGLYAGEILSNGSIRLEVGVRIGDGVGIRGEHGTHGDIVRKITVRGREVKAARRGETANLYLNAGEGNTVTLTSGVIRRAQYPLKTRGEIKVHRCFVPQDLPAIGGGCFDGIRLLAKAYSAGDAVKAVEFGADAVYYNVFEKDYPGGEVNPYVPRCLTEWNARKAVDLVEAHSPPTVLCGDLGVASSLGAVDVVLDSSCNAFNDFDVGFFNRLGLTPMVSPELSISEIVSFKDKRFVVYAHGRLPLMTTKYLLDADSMKDEKGYVFPVRKESDYRQVLNSMPLGLFDWVKRLKDAKVGHYLLDLWGEDPSIVSTYRRILSGENVKKPGNYTVGNYRDGVD